MVDAFDVQVAVLLDHVEHGDAEAEPLFRARAEEQFVVGAEAEEVVIGWSVCFPRINRNAGG